MKRLAAAALLITAACTSVSGIPAPAFQPPATATLSAPAAPSPTPFQPLPPTPFQTPAPSPTPTAIPIWVHPALHAALPPYLTAADRESARLLLTAADQGEIVFAERIYALAAPFPTIPDGVTFDEALALWRSTPAALIADPATAAALSVHWGPPGEGLAVLPPGDLLNHAWETGAWAILPFEALEPRWKTLQVDGQSPLNKNFDPQAYALTIPFTLRGDPELAAAVSALAGPGTAAPLVAPTNRDPEKLSTVVLTGVTALVRATAFAMEQQGLHYPARDIGGWLRDADLLHISNEVPFAENCPFPNPVQVGVVFCSDPDYIALLEEIGTDVVELTGDHFHDWGSQAMLFTLNLYADRGWPVYGGGATFEEGKQAALLEHHGNRFAFIGCNGKGGTFARASATSPGAVRCDFDWLKAEIGRLQDAGYTVIATFQHFEYYTYAAPAPMQGDFRALAEAGAAVISGSQAHHPHGFEFHRGSFIHYGLGNLFFDQLGISPGTEQAFIDRHVFYEGRHLGVELLTIRFEDFARARPMTAAERDALLRQVFSASGW